MREGEDILELCTKKKKGDKWRICSVFHGVDGMTPVFLFGFFTLLGVEVDVFVTIKLPCLDGVCITLCIFLATLYC